MAEMTPLTSEELEALEHNWKHFGMLMDKSNIGRLLAEVRRCWQVIERQAHAYTLSSEEADKINYAGLKVLERRKNEQLAAAQNRIAELEQKLAEGEANKKYLAEYGGIRCMAYCPAFSGCPIGPEGLAHTCLLSSGHNGPHRFECDFTKLEAQVEALESAALDNQTERIRLEAEVARLAEQRRRE